MIVKFIEKIFHAFNSLKNNKIDVIMTKNKNLF